MAENDPLYDGALDFLGGQDASKIPDRIADNCYYAGVNVSVYKGSIRPRWGLTRKKLIFSGQEFTFPSKLTRPYEDIFHSGKFQALIPYSIGKEYYLIVVIAGTIFLINQDTWDVSVLDISDGSRLDERKSRLNWTNAGKYVVIFDYPNYPVFIENAAARRADPALMECPVAVNGLFNQNRLFISNAGNEFTAGDPVGSLMAPDAPISFLELLTPGSQFYGQIFQVPTNYTNDAITALAFLQVVDTSTGIGPFLAATKSGIWSFATQQARTEWEGTQFGAVLLYNAGIAGARAFSNVNSDLFFMSNDGQLRAISMSRSEQSKWTKEPISREVENWLKLWDRDLVKFGQVSYFRNKIFVTANPFRSKALTTDRFPISDYAHGGFVVLETDNIATLGNTSPPVWAGLWTGVNPMDTVINNERFFVISKDADFRNNIWEYIPETSIDEADGKIRYVRSRIYTKEHDFKNPFANKTIHSVRFNLDNVQGDFSLDVKYKPSHGSYFLPWRTFTHKAPWRTKLIPTPAQLNGFFGQHIRDLSLGFPESDTCSPVTRDYYRMFKKIQLEITVSGKYWEIHEYMIKAIEAPQNETESVCSEFPMVEIHPDAADDDWAVENIDNYSTDVT